MTKTVVFTCDAGSLPTTREWMLQFPNQLGLQLSQKQLVYRSFACVHLQLALRQGDNNIHRYCVHLKFIIYYYSNSQVTNVPQFGKLVGVGATDTVTVLVIVIIQQMLSLYTHTATTRRTTNRQKKKADALLSSSFLKRFTEMESVVLTV